MISWGEFAALEPELAAFGAQRLRTAPAYLASVRADGSPRVHPVTPIFTDEAMFVFMEPTSPKGRDLRERGWFAMHNAVPDNSGTGGEFFLSGIGSAVDDPSVRAAVVNSATYEPAERYVLFELRLREARCNGYGDVELPEHRRWTVTG